MSNPTTLPQPGSTVRVRHLWDGGHFTGVLVEDGGQVVTQESRGDTWARLRLQDGAYWWVLWSADTSRVQYEVLSAQEPASAEQAPAKPQQQRKASTPPLDAERLSTALRQAQARRPVRQPVRATALAPVPVPEPEEPEESEFSRSSRRVASMVIAMLSPEALASLHSTTTAWTDQLLTAHSLAESSGQQAPEMSDDRPLPTQEAILRPKTLDEYDVGQPMLVANLKVRIAAALEKGTALPHCLFDGPPGLGKTTLAYIIANELGVKMHPTSGPALDEPSAVLGLLFDLREGDVLFVDEIHRLAHPVGEYLYHAMEDFQIDYIEGEKGEARTMVRRLEPFTLIGATTNAGAMAPALRDRFGIRHELDYYEPQQLSKIGARTAEVLGITIEGSALEVLARRSRGTARVINSLIQHTWDWALVLNNGLVTPPLVDQALAALGVDEIGLSPLDRRYMTAILDYYDGGPVGINAIAATLGNERRTIEEVVEPYLVRQGYVTRTARGRTLTDRGKEHVARHREEN